MQIIPGTIDAGKIDEEFLNNWVDTVRKLAKDVDRQEPCDGEIGRILAQYPEENLNWPPNEICKVIERINTTSLKSGFSAGTFNKRGSSTRGVFDGGDIERRHAKYFQKLSQNRRDYPVVSKLLASIADGFLLDARRMDEEAEREELEF